MMEEKLHFVCKEFVLLAAKLHGNEAGRWGKMNAQQMVEHVADFFKISTNKIQFPFVSSPEHLEKLRAFLYSEKEFRENTKAPVLPEEPFPLRFASMKEAIDELHSETEHFILFFKKDPNIKTQHPVFGDLNFEEWILLHYKHLQHHAKQFGLI